MVVFGRIISTLLRNAQLGDVTQQCSSQLDHRSKLKSAEPAVCTADLLNIRVSLDETQCRWARVYRRLKVVPLKHRLRGPRSTQPLNPWRRRQYFPSKRCEKVTQKHSVTFQKTRVLNPQSTSYFFPPNIYLRHMLNINCRDRVSYSYWDIRHKNRLGVKATSEIFLHF
jgi:hypothetical protein